MSEGVKIEIGGSAAALAEGFIDAWKKAEAGEVGPTRRVLSFETWAGFMATFTPARVALLKHLAAEGGAPSINALAKALDRPYRRVHDDVVALEEAGLIEREGNRLLLLATQFDAHLDLAA